MEKVLPFKLHKKGKGRVHKFRIMNTLACFANVAIKSTLYNYLGYVNVAEDDRQYIKMKNEFYYSRVIVTNAKKSYIALMERQEAHIYPKPKIDVKGVSFFKSTASEKTSRFIYDELLWNQLLQPKDGVLSLKRTYRTIIDFQRKIADDIRSGDMGFLKRSIRVKSPDAYANPMRISQYKAVYVWNSVNGDTEQIKLPDTVTIAKVVLKNKKDVAALAPWPEIYDRMMRLFETDPVIGDHLVKKNGKERMVKGSGVNAIALPNEYDEVPDWVLAILDVDTLVNENMRLMSQIHLALGFSGATTTHNKNQMKYYTNIVRL